MTAPEYTPDQLIDGIARAIKATDWDGVTGLLRRLAVIAPDRAQAVLDTIDLGVTLSRAER